MAGASRKILHHSPLLSTDKDVEEYVPGCVLDTGLRARVLNLAFMVPMPNLWCGIGGVSLASGFFGEESPEDTF